VFGVSPAGYYAWRSRPESERATANRELLIEVKRIHHDSHHGSPRVHAVLQAQGRPRGWRRPWVGGAGRPGLCFEQMALDDARQIQRYDAGGVHVRRRQ
jgi:hypothetical protein